MLIQREISFVLAVGSLSAYEIPRWMKTEKFLDLFMENLVSYTQNVIYSRQGSQIQCPQSFIKNGIHLNWNLARSYC